MSELESLLAAIAAAPDDDTPRLVIADFLEEHGQPERAEFIRLQCRIASLLAQVEQWSRTPSNQPGGSREDGGEAGAALAEAQGLRARERELWESKSGSEWAIRGVKPDAPDWIVHEVIPQNSIASSPTANLIFWSRGFPARLRCSWDDCAAHLDSILADPWVPGLDEVELTTWPSFDEAISLAAAASQLLPMQMGQDETWFHAFNARWKYIIEGKTIPAVRKWILPPQYRGENFYEDAMIARQLMDEFGINLRGRYPVHPNPPEES